MFGLADIRDFIKTLNCGAERYYIGKLDAKPNKAIGIYSRNGPPPRKTIGGNKNKSYEEKAVSILIHWTNNARETEEAAFLLYQKLEALEHEFEIGETRVRFVRMDTGEPIDVGADEKGIYERVIWLTFIYEI